MKITSVEAIPLKVPLGEMETYWAGDMWSRDEVSAKWLRPANEWRYRPIYSDYIETLLIKVSTDEGIVGWGETHAPYAADAYVAIVDRFLSPLLIGEDPFAIAYLWEKMYASMRLRGHASGFQLEAIAGVDIALWDLKGRALNQSICSLLGGPMPNELRAYHSHLPAMAPSTLARLAAQHIAEGFTGIKLCGGAGVRADIAAVSAVRDAVGPEVRIMVDAGGAYTLPSALALGKELEHLGVYFFEDPMPHELIEDYGRLAGSLALAIAGGEAKCNRYEFKALMDVGGLDVVLPDISRAGGITECHRIGMLADVHGALFCPHISVGSAVYIAASLQLSAALPNLALVEHWSGRNPIGEGLIEEQFGFTDGVIQLPTGPGLGVTISESVLAQVRA